MKKTLALLASVAVLGTGLAAVPAAAQSESASPTAQRNQRTARAALLKGLSMGLFGVFVIARTAWSLWSGGLPEPLTMGLIGALALGANLGVAALLYAWREGDANMRSVWLCTRNDALGNLAVMGAALGVFGSGTAWPDLFVAAVMAGLALTAAHSVIRQALQELRRARAASA